MVETDNIDTLLFDVLGTVVDEAGSMRSAIAESLGPPPPADDEIEAIARNWERNFTTLVAAIVAGAPWRSTDELNAESLSASLRNGPQLTEQKLSRLALVGHRLSPWPDAQAALTRLALRFTTVALSNGNLSLLADLFAHAGLTWHAVLSGEMVHAYKPDPAVYQFALERLELDPRRTLMVAAHPWDLRAASALGLRTAYVERSGEGQPDPSDRFDLTAPDLAQLAEQLMLR